MARKSLSKSALLHETRQLKIYRRYLPSLELKRLQLIAERAKARGQLAETHKAQEELRAYVGRELPMLSNHDVDLPKLVRLEGVALEEQNLLGTLLPVVGKVKITRRPYSFLVRPPWVDTLADKMAEMITLKVTERIQQIRLERLEAAVQKITQRVNLFDKVLIPRTEARIREIRIHLGDAERAAVVRAKIAKKRRFNVAET
ncbi:V/A-type H+-transporting ATPase subunit D [Geoalkalibacter ferrihydriticus]|uniref:ATP synthase subunit D n=2 Tax=Geoalkalibacter ferrihydriticus TaxID=392333 RepID=A0A0C2DUY8_9BACT|nr:V-type ATP synthase subunit D [Geoalkalibacter ferrihydriticus]KIH77239.1 ATP synthase subunit D [Geoalkalibacter ferrihydriticus DSM 17813]SDM23950.1 V/A-type H+-transporting ATPase subunit D [Geoalkalibacter ferrihydriticus]